MNFSFPYGGNNLSLDTGEREILFTGRMRDIAPLPNLGAAVCRALDRPARARPFKELARGRRDILFLVEDNTRETPLDEILPVVTRYLNENGVGDENISLMIAPGTHRRMSRREIVEKLGHEIVSRFRITQHDAGDKSMIADLGTVEARGYAVPVRVNRRVLRADLVVGFGNIIPHCNAGFSGGAKIAVPGVCDSATTAAVHAASAFHPRIPLGENDTNPCRAAIEAGAKKIGMDFILNVVLNHRGKTAGVFAGDFIAAHREGAALAAKLFNVAVPRRAGIVVAGSSPADIDFWQAGKGLAAAAMAVKESGIIILAARCREGLAHNHPRYREYLRHSLEENLTLIRGARPEDGDADVTAASVAAENNKIRSMAKVFIVTEGLSGDDIDALGFERYDSLQGAFEAALKIDPSASVGLLPRGGHALPVLKTN